MLIARIVVSNDIIFEENPFINSLSPLLPNNSIMMRLLSMLLFL